MDEQEQDGVGLDLEEVELTEQEVSKLLEEFCFAYQLQKGTDLDDVELVVYEQKKRTVIYFRQKIKELKQYGPEILQD